MYFNQTALAHSMDADNCLPAPPEINLRPMFKTAIVPLIPEFAIGDRKSGVGGTLILCTLMESFLLIH